MEISARIGISWHVALLHGMLRDITHWPKSRYAEAKLGAFTNYVYKASLANRVDTFVIKTEDLDNVISKRVSYLSFITTFGMDTIPCI